MAGPGKKEIRRERREQEKEIPAAYFRDASRKIAEKVLGLPAWKQAGTVMAYVSTETEPDTRELIGAAEKAGKRVLLPRCADRQQMEAVPFTGWERMRKNAYGIPEPIGEAAEEMPEVILVPCVAATAMGTRLGHGAGYYDRFLRNQPGHRVCLCFGKFLMDELPAEEWDIPMEMVITEKEIFTSVPENEYSGRKLMKEYRFYGWERADVREAHGLTPRDMYDLLSACWSAETCAPRMRKDWTEENRTLGQCSITAFLMQDFFGGKVYGVPLEDGNYHCFNAVGDCVFDLTSEQFGNTPLDYRNCPEQDREIHFARAEKKERYEQLRDRLLEQIRNSGL